ncbi:MAG TPA: ATP-binding cassette domain-containing protein [Gammaproteobacteria bacterium]|nr:ATP-binding cassette domain-containing protein [Gammaproteobacteria bacterium]HIK68348.1 ATP-binding cassette domain-containing protein [Pseudomonadales bacterium]
MLDLTAEQKKKRRSLKPLAALVPFVLPYKGTLVLALIALLISSAAVLAMPLAVREVIDNGFSTDDATRIDSYFLVLMAFTLLIGFFGAARAYFVNWLGERVVADLRDRVFRHVVAMDPTFFETTKIGEVLSRLTADTTLIQSISGAGLSIVLRSSIQFIGALALLAYTNLKLTAILVILLPLVITPILMIGQWVRRLSRSSQDRVADASGYAAEILNAVETVQEFTAEERESQRFGKAIETSFDTAVLRIRVRALMTMVATTVLFGTFIFVIWMGATEVLSGSLSGGELGQFVIYAILVGASGAALSEFWGELQRAAGAMERIVELLQMQPAIRPPAQPLIIPPAQSRQIHFDDVTFSYPSRPGKAVIKQFCLNINPGEHIALVGASGAGKSTVFHLLLRFYDPSRGKILIDDIDITRADPRDVRRLIGIVSQETTLFGLSAAENIRFGRPDATPDEIIKAAQAAHAHTFISQLTDGYDTHLGEKGTRLSGGQKQRIAIARAVLKDPPILLLDEATSSLDADSERLVQKALERLQQDRTTMVIAHRLSTIVKADRIVLLEDGRIIDIGHHQELLEREPRYARMVQLQFASSSQQGSDSPLSGVHNRPAKSVVPSS